MSDPQYYNSEYAYGKINCEKSASSEPPKNDNKDDMEPECLCACATADESKNRYTDGYEAWLEATNKEYVADIVCLAVAVEDIQILLDRIAELEAAAQWHPASEPPECDGWYDCILETPAQCGHEWNIYRHITPVFFGGAFPRNCTHWAKRRDLPPMPEVK
jgi:hypothetical protein